MLRTTNAGQDKFFHVFSHEEHEKEKRARNIWQIEAKKIIKEIGKRLVSE